MYAASLVAVLTLVFSAAAQPFSPDAEGFIRNWLVLAPIAIEGEAGATEIDRDFLKSFGATRGEYVAGYAVAYVVADEEMKVTLALSTNDQGKAWLNGKPIFKFAETRTLEKDADRIEVTLAKGQNILVLKVINEVNNWQACARFLKDGAPVKNLKISAAPQ